VDETSLRAELDRALSSEPPLGHLVGNSMRKGRKLLQRRRLTAAAAVSAAAFVVVTAVPLLTPAAGHKGSRPEPAATPAAARTAYVANSPDTVVPVSLATNAVGKPIKVPVNTLTGLGPTTVSATPDGRTVYAVGFTEAGAAVTPIDTTTNTAGRTITLPDTEPIDIAIDPNGKTAYLAGEGGVFPINIATNRAGREIKIPARCWTMAFTPDGKMLYVLDDPGGSIGYQSLTVTPIRTATNTALAPIKLLPVPNLRFGPGPYGFDIAITPGGTTAYIVAGDQQGRPYFSSVIPIDLATNKALKPIAIAASGMAAGLVFTPGGRTAYVVSGRAVTPIDTATNRAEPAINLPQSAGWAYRIALTPNGKTMYVLTPRGVIPIETASGTVLPMIGVPQFENLPYMAITPDGKTVYVRTTSGLIPISTATNTAGNPINLGGPAMAITFAG
jgi:DNA-binding beta-propeller fold protein YncE